MTQSGKLYALQADAGDLLDDVSAITITGGGTNIFGDIALDASDARIYAFDNATGELAITSAVPEPSAFAAFAGLVGLVAVGARRRRR